MPTNSSTLLARATAGLVAVLTCGCGDSLATDDVVGSYVLRRVGPDPLPTVLFSNDYVTSRVLSDTLQLTTNGRGTRASLQVVQQRATGVVDTVRSEAGFRFQVSDGRVEIAFDCPINANCAPPPHLVGHPLSGDLEIDYALGARVPLLYARILDFH